MVRPPGESTMNRAWFFSLGLHVLFLPVAVFWVVSIFAADEEHPTLPVNLKVTDIVTTTTSFGRSPKDDLTIAEEHEVNDGTNEEDEVRYRIRDASLDMVSDKPFNGMGLYDTMDAGAGGGGVYGGRRYTKRELIARGGGSLGTEQAVLEALKWLMRHQNPDGSWSVKDYIRHCDGKNTSKPNRYSGTCDPAPGESDHEAGVTGLAVLAFLGAGYDTDSQYIEDGIVFGKTVKRGLKWIMAHQDEEGCLGGRSGHTYMYHHLICSLALSEAYGFKRGEDLGLAAQRAVAFTVAAQNEGKGWRYKPRSGDTDTSVTSWAVLSLAVAELSGLSIPRNQVYSGARAWLDEVMRDDEDFTYGYYSKEEGKLRIPPDEWRGGRFTTTAMAMTARMFMKDPKDKRTEEQIKYLLKSYLPAWSSKTLDFCYLHFGSLAIFHADGPDGPHWKKWNEAMKKALVKNQNTAQDDKKGSWEPVDRWSSVGGPAPSGAGQPRTGRYGGGRVYATAINALTLETYYRYPRLTSSLAK